MKRLLIASFAFVLGLSAQTVYYTNSQTISVSAGSITVTPNAGSPQQATFEEITSGGPTATTVTIQGCTASNVCITIDSYGSAGNSDVTRLLKSPRYDHFQITASWSGGSGVQVTIVTTISGIGNQAIPAPSFNTSYTDLAEIANPQPPASGFERFFGSASFGACTISATGTVRCTGTGGVGGTGSTGFLSLWLNANTLAISGLQDNGMQLTYGGTFQFGTPDGIHGTCEGLSDATGAHTFSWCSSDSPGIDVKLKSPTSAPAAGHAFCVKSDGMTFGTCSSAVASDGSCTCN